MTDFTKLPPEELSRVTTRDGRKVRILCVDGPGTHPIVGLIGREFGACYWRVDGTCWATRSYCDLFLTREELAITLMNHCGSWCVFESGHPQGDRRYVKDEYRITLGDNPTIERVK